MPRCTEASRDRAPQGLNHSRQGGAVRPNCADDCSRRRRVRCRGLRGHLCPLRPADGGVLRGRAADTRTDGGPDRRRVGDARVAGAGARRPGDRVRVRPSVRRARGVPLVLCGQHLSGAGAAPVRRWSPAVSGVAGAVGRPGLPPGTGWDDVAERGQRPVPPRPSASSRSVSTARSAGRAAPGTTSPGSRRRSWTPRARRPSPADNRIGASPPSAEKCARRQSNQERCLSKKSAVVSIDLANWPSKRWPCPG